MVEKSMKMRFFLNFIVFIEANLDKREMAQNMANNQNEKKKYIKTECHENCQLYVAINKKIDHRSLFMNLKNLELSYSLYIMTIDYQIKQCYKDSEKFKILIVY